MRPLTTKCSDCEAVFDVPTRGMVPERCKPCRQQRVKDQMRQYRQEHQDQLRIKRNLRIAKEVRNASPVV